MTNPLMLERSLPCGNPRNFPKHQKAGRSESLSAAVPLTAVYTAPLKPATIRSIWSRRVVYRSVSTLPA